ncbi:MAG: linear amide C-N hydrolase [Proteobacteria bacterium]|nr:linear amide C-N hydrolase [Pseudomonadota bacterium]
MKKILLKWVPVVIFTAITIFFTISIADACTEFKLSYDGQPIIGHNFDWANPYAFIVINPVGIKRRSGSMDSHFKPLEWVSKYGSATINLAGPDHRVMPQAVVSGLNQFGLSASILWLESAQYPSGSTQTVLGTSQWVQYFLDNAKTVTEAIELARHVEVEPTLFHGQKILAHLMIHDASGASAVIEYLNGKLNIYYQKDLPVPVLTNTPYLESTQLLKQYHGFGKDTSLPGGYFTKARFVLAANFLKNLPTSHSTQQAVASAFNGLGYLIETPGSSDPTVWSVVYDLSNRILYYRTIDNQQIRLVHLDHFNLAKGQPVRIMSMTNDFIGEVENHFSIH